MDIADMKTHSTCKMLTWTTAKQVSKTSSVLREYLHLKSKQFLVSVTKEGLEKSPLRYPVGRGLCSLDSRQMCFKADKCLASLKKVLDALIAAMRLSYRQQYCTRKVYRAVAGAKT